VSKHVAKFENLSDRNENAALLHRLMLQEQQARAAGFKHTADALARWRDREKRSLIDLDNQTVSVSCKQSRLLEMTTPTSGDFETH
jgi:hypothetical protein